jgi:hypothetical protein
MRTVENSIYDTNSKATFIQNTDLILNLFHVNWLCLLGLRKGLGAKKNTKYFSYIRNDKLLRPDSIGDDNNDISLITKLANDAGLVSNVTMNHLTKFLVKLKQDPYLDIDETLIRGLIDTATEVKLPKDPILKKIRADFVGGKTLLDLMPALWSYIKKHKTEFSSGQTRGEIYSLMTYAFYNKDIFSDIPWGTVSQSPSSSSASATSTASASSSSTGGVPAPASITPRRDWKQDYLDGKDNYLNLAPSNEKIDLDVNVVTKLRIEISGMGYNKAQLLARVSSDATLDENVAVAAMLYYGVVAVITELGSISNAWTDALSDFVTASPNVDIKHILHGLADYANTRDKIEELKLSAFDAQFASALDYYMQDSTIPFLFNVCELSDFPKTKAAFKKLSITFLYTEPRRGLMPIEKLFSTARPSSLTSLIGAPPQEWKLYIPLVRVLGAERLFNSYLTKGRNSDYNFSDHYRSIFLLLATVMLSERTVTLDGLLTKVNNFKASLGRDGNPYYLDPILDLISTDLINSVDSSTVDPKSSAGILYQQSRNKTDEEKVTALSTFLNKVRFTSDAKDEFILNLCSLIFKLGNRQKVPFLLLATLIKEISDPTLLDTMLNKLTNGHLIGYYDIENEEQVEAILFVATHLGIKFSSNDFSSYSIGPVFEKIKDNEDLLKRFISNADPKAVRLLDAIFSCLKSISSKTLINFTLDTFNIKAPYVDSLKRIADGKWTYDYTSLLVSLLRIDLDIFKDPSNVKALLNTALPGNSLKRSLLIDLTTFSVSEFNNLSETAPSWGEISSMILTFAYDAKKVLDTGYDFTVNKRILLLSVAAERFMDDLEGLKYIIELKQFSEAQIAEAFSFVIDANSVKVFILSALKTSSAATNVISNRMSASKFKYEDLNQENILLMSKTLDAEVFAESLLQRELTDSLKDNLSLLTDRLLNLDDDSEEFEFLNKVLFKLTNKNPMRMYAVLKAAVKSGSDIAAVALELTQSNDLPLSPVVSRDIRTISSYILANTQSSAADINAVNLETYVKGSDIKQYLSAQISNNARNNTILPAPKVTQLPITDLDKYSFEFNRDYNSLIHGRRVLKIQKVFEVTPSQENTDKYNEFKDKLIADGTAFEEGFVFHGTGTLAANMILRYGFLVTKGDMVKAGRMLGDGIYFAPAVDKSIQYFGDKTSNVTRSRGVQGYILGVQVIIAKGYSSSAAGMGHIKSNEYCLFGDPRTYSQIVKAYYGEIEGFEFMENYASQHNITLNTNQFGRRCFGSISTR